MLDDGRCLLVVDQPCRLDDELFGVVLELIKDRLFNAGENLDNGFSGQPRFTYQLSDEVILDAVIGADALAAVIGGRAGL